MTAPVSAYGALLVSALLPIVGGAHASLKMPTAARARSREMRGLVALPDEEADEVERLTATDAYLFPVLGSATLLGLYLAFTHLDKAMINFVLGLYFALVGGLASMSTLVEAARACASETRWTTRTRWRLALSRDGARWMDVRFTTVHLAALLLAGATTAYHRYAGQPWWLSNVLALSLSMNAISLLRLDSFFTGIALLSGLFVYDIYWVFATDVMVTVARNFDAPIKIVWPKELGVPATGFTLLGLGDIVLPGIFLALALRFDYHRALHTALQVDALPPSPSSGFARPYFLACFVAYIAGLATTIGVMHTFQAAQPALLYLSPACIGSVTLCALLRGELAQLWAFDDASDDDEKVKGVAERERRMDKESESVEVQGIARVLDEVVEPDEVTAEVVEKPEIRRRTGLRSEKP